MIEQLMNGETVPEWEGEWLAAEERTSCLYCFDTYLINGLLQCPDYMQDILGSEDAVKMRQERQRRFLDAYSGRTLIAVMSENTVPALGSCGSMCATCSLVSRMAVAMSGTLE